MQISVLFLRKLGIALPQDPAIPLLGVYSKDFTPYYRAFAHPCSLLFIIAEIGNFNGRVNNENVVHLPKGIIFSCLKMNFPEKWIEIEKTIIQSEVI